MGRKVVIIIAAVLIVDQIVKVLIKTQLSPHENIPVFEGFFQLYYIENRGMAFGTTLGEGVWAKYVLSLFRLVAIIGIAWYIRKLLRDPTVHRGLIVAMGLIFAGAMGNLIDGMFYDYIFGVDGDIAWNWQKDGKGDWLIDPASGEPVLRQSGFLLGSVVDMCQFTLKWPSWMPWGLGGEEIFAAIWNVADASISVGVGLIIVRYRAFFRKPPTDTAPEDGQGEVVTVQSTTTEEE